jgi:hypothetical protein
MRLGMSPRLASLDAVRRIVSKLDDFSGGVIALNATGHHGAACHGLTSFPYCHQNQTLKDVEIVTIACTKDLQQLDDMILIESLKNSFKEKDISFSLIALVVFHKILQ